MTLRAGLFRVLLHLLAELLVMSFDLLWVLCSNDLWYSHPILAMFFQACQEERVLVFWPHSQVLLPLRFNDLVKLSVRRIEIVLHVSFILFDFSLYLRWCSTPKLFCDRNGIISEFLDVGNELNMLLCVPGLRVDYFLRFWLASFLIPVFFATELRVTEILFLLIDHSLLLARLLLVLVEIKHAVICRILLVISFVLPPLLRSLVQDHWFVKFDLIVASVWSV